MGAVRRATPAVYSKFPGADPQNAAPTRAGRPSLFRALPRMLPHRARAAEERLAAPQCDPDSLPIAESTQTRPLAISPLARASPATLRARATPAGRAPAIR